jgi:hypothetical protein
MLIPFVENGDTRLDLWNVGIVEVGRADYSADRLGSAGHVAMVRRAKLKDSGRVADIKALMSKRDILFDCTATGDDGGWEDLKAERINYVGQRPLLLIYPIDRRSEPERPSKVRVPLDAAYDVIGIGLVFPGSVTEGGNFVSVELRPLSADEIAEIADEEAAQAEAAGVK